MTVGLVAGGLVGALLAMPVVADKQQRGHEVEEGTSSLRASMPRRLAGFGANFAVPGAMLVASGHTGAHPGLRGGLIAAAAAVPGAYWGVRQLFDV